MKRLFITISAICLFSLAVSAQQAVKKEEAQVKQNLQTKQAQSQQYSKKEVKASQVAKTEKQIEVKEKKAVPSNVKAQPNHKVVESNPRLENKASQKAVKSESVKSINKTAATEQKKSANSPK